MVKKKKKSYNPKRRPVRGHLAFLAVFGVSVLVLWLANLLWRNVSAPSSEGILHTSVAQIIRDSITDASDHTDSLHLTVRPPLRLIDSAGNPVKHRVMSVHDFKEAFPDLNDVQLATAQRIGIRACENRDEAARRLDELVFVGDSPYYDVESLKHSIPYLVPRAATLLNEIGRNFLDSLASKGIPFHKMRVTSILRTQEDVRNLRRRNGNASEQSCHQYGTTFDISYNIYRRVQDPDLEPQVETWAVTLKSVLSEVLNDQRKLGTCYVKYEYRQSCFHVTVR